MNAQEEKINWAPGATEYEWTSPCKHNLIKYIAIKLASTAWQRR